MRRVIKKLIFIGLTENQANLVKSLKVEYNELHEDLYMVFMEDIEELFYHLDAGSLVISHPQNSRQVMDLLIQLGQPWYLHWADFLGSHQNLAKMQVTPCGRKVCLAFIPENFQKLYDAVFRMYGCEIFIADTAEELETILNSGVDYLVFDMDMKKSSERIRYKTLQQISSHCKKGLRAGVIKNFDNGSLFNDILSPVKEISNILLSPEEYLLFLRKYLYSMELENFYREHPDRINAFENWRQGEEYRNANQGAGLNPAKEASRGNRNYFTGIRDGKKSYNQVLALRMNPHWADIVHTREIIDLKFSLSLAIEECIALSMENSQRELFTFFPQ